MKRVALYEKQGRVDARCITDSQTDCWRSKMGQGPVIEHLSPESLSGGMYGNPTIYMRRALAALPFERS